MAAQALVFESFEGIEACLAAIAEDPDAVILRIKNRYTHSYDAVETGGYRFQGPCVHAPPPTGSKPAGIECFC
jgi:hypothetical protein